MLSREACWKCFVIARRSSGTRIQLEDAAIAALSATAQAALRDARRFERDIDDLQELSPGLVWLLEQQKGADENALSTSLRSTGKRWRCQRARGCLSIRDDIMGESEADDAETSQDFEVEENVEAASKIAGAFAAWHLLQARRARLTLHREARARRAGQVELGMHDERIEGRALQEAVVAQLRKPRRRPGRSRPRAARRVNELPGQLTLPLYEPFD
jgi:hypothetical protein